MLGLSMPSRGQQHDLYAYGPASYVCQRTTTALTIDGQLDDTDWQRASWTAPFQDIMGDYGDQPYFQTRVKMLWDDNFFYIAAELEEEHLWATYDERDMVIFHENDFEVFIDANGDTHNYYELEINALGTTWDLLLTKPYRDGGRAIDAWDIRDLKKGVALQGTLNDASDMDTKWTIELAFPWTVLQEAAPKKLPEDGDIWRVNFSRVQWRLNTATTPYTKQVNAETGEHLPEQNWVWSPQGAVAMHQPETWGFVQFSNKAAGSNVRFVPDNNDPTKWLLRQVYYKQKTYFEDNASYASSTLELKLPDELYERARIALTPSDYEVSLDGWSIRSDGLIFRTGSSKK